MPNIRVRDNTYWNLVKLKHGMESISDVIDNLLTYREQYLQLILKKDQARKAKGG